MLELMLFVANDKVQFLVKIRILENLFALHAWLFGKT
jgi:hypothetical protein